MKRTLAYLLAVLPLAGCVISKNVGPEASGALVQPSASTADQEVAWNEGRVARDPKGAIGWSQLAGAYLRVARLRDDNTAASKAESAAKKSLSLRRKNNVQAAIRLTQSILAQHRFAEALEAANQAILIAPDDPQPHQIHAEILTELGRYDEAWKEVKQYHLTGMAGMALQARLFQVDGKPETANRLLKACTVLADRNFGMEPEAKAWFHYKYGLALWESAQLTEGAEEFMTAINLNPRDFKSKAALARLSATQGDLEAGKRLALESIEITPTVEAASLMEDISALKKDGAAVSKYQTLVDKVSHPEMYQFLTDPEANQGTTKPHTHDRLYAMYLADHSRNLADALAAAKKDLESRQDVFAYDTLAWVLHQMGRDSEAKEAMVKAMARGTQDSKMLFHAGMIESALGNTAQAKTLVDRALALNPAFQFGQVEIAKQVSR